MKSFRAFRLDTANQCLWRGQERVAVTPKAYDLLRYLIENPGRLVTQDEFLEKLWPQIYVNPELIERCFSQLHREVSR
jgi:DNA-binding winged helix-turn-helix (wHTH) protein